MFDMEPVMRDRRLLGTCHQVSCLDRITPCWVVSERVSHLMGHIPYEIGSQVTQRGLPSAKCASAMPLFLNCWQALPHFAVWKPVGGVVDCGACCRFLGCRPPPTAAQPSQVALLQAVPRSSQRVEWWAPKVTVSCLSLETPGH